MLSMKRPDLGRVAWRLTLLAATAGIAVVAVGVGGAASRKAAVTPPSNTSPPSATGTPQQASGTPQQGQSLLAVTGGWAGDTPLTFTFRWQRCEADGGLCADIPGAVAQSYTLAAADVGKTVRVVVTATNAAGSSTAASATTAPVTAPGTAPSAQKQPDPSGSAIVGQTVTVDNGSWSGATPITFTYQWQRCTAAGASCTDIGGATGQTYVIQQADAGMRLRATVKATNSAGSASISSNLTGVVASTIGAPVNTSAPTVAGTFQLAQTLTGNPGGWSGAQPIAFAYSWNRCDANGANCRAIPGAVSSIYRTGNEDVGARLQFVVRASNSIGSAVGGSAITPAIARGALPAGATQLPDGQISIPATSVSAPERLVVSGIQFSANPVRTRTSFTARFRITDTRGYVVRDALVYAIGLPYGWFRNARELPTGTDGYVVIPITPTAQLPVGRRGAAVFFVRARKAGDNLLTGVSTRRLVQVRLG